MCEIESKSINIDIFPHLAKETSIDFAESLEEYSNASPHIYEVIIIGAGISGVGAGNLLLKRKITNFCILEAQKQAGGRIKTSGNVEEGFLECGAQWIHGEAPDNAIHCAILKADLVYTDVIETDGEGEFYSEAGQKLTDDVRLIRARECFDMMNREIYMDQLISHKYSVEEYFSLKYEKFLKDKCQEDRLIYSCFYNWMNRWDRVDNACHSMNTISALKWQEYKFCNGQRNITPKNGMISVFNEIAKELEDKIYLNNIVIGIHFKKSVGTTREDLDDINKRPVSVYCKNGKIYRCNHVIVTSSLGFLKDNLHIFSPPLPEKLENAIQNHGYGNIGKIFLQFDTKWWDWKDGSLQLVWTDSLPQFNDATTNPWWKGICGLNEVHGRKNTLVAWIGGDECAAMEWLPMDEVITKLVEILTTFTGKSNIPQPIHAYRSEFSTNEYFNGGYSHPIRENDSQNIIETLNIPIYGQYTDSLKIPYLTFAGEANSVNYYSTMHGALENGMQQAQIYCDWRNK